jgi:type IV pilus biogenesis protein PilP
MLTGFAVVSPAGPASAQDGTQPLAAQPPGNAPPGQPTTDPITNEQIELLKESGLIDKQSRLSEGLLLMDRQLRQAELVEQLLTVLGPDAEIEVTPGEFKSFADTPADLKLQADLQAAKLAMGVGQETGTEITEIYGKSDDLVAVITLDGRETAVVAGDRLADGSVVLSITPEKVELADQDGAIRALKAP